MTTRDLNSPPLPRAWLDLEPEVLWVMCCAEGPMPLPAAHAVRQFLVRETRPWRLRWREDFQGIPAATRAAAALLLSAQPEDVSLVATTSAGLQVVARGFPWRPGDEVVVPLGEFPSNFWPWRALASRGVALREIPLWPGHRAGREAWSSTPPDASATPEASLLAALSPSTRVLSVSWVRFQDGLVLDLPRLAAGCRERGVALVVDGIQGAGVLPVAVEGLDAFVAGGHKGLLAPQGLGLLWTEPRFRGTLAANGTWLSVEDATDFRRPSTDFERDWRADGSRFEPGVPNLVGAVALRASLELLGGVGAARIADHVGRLRRRLFDGLGEIPAWRPDVRRLEGLDAAGRLGPIVALHHGGVGFAGLDRLLQDGLGRGIYASVREGYLRIAFHGWHDGGDVDRILAWLAEASASG